MNIVHADGSVTECPAEEELRFIRHTAAHILAQAVKRLYPQARFGYGPATEKGFYYDIDLGDTKLGDEDLTAIEAEMRKIVKENLPIKPSILPREEAIALMQERGECYKVEHIADLPEAFDGYRIAQISDMHVGTYGTDDTFVAKIVDTVNSLEADMVVFTGDIVNRHADEIRPFLTALSKIHGADGQYAILGNHDYADYYYIDNPRARENDRARLINFYSLTSFDLILDDYRTIYRGNDSIIVIGVENVGRPPFPAYGNLDIAYPDLGDDNTKILLSHDPSHWHYDIAGHHDKNIALTLSGHTHAMQTCIFGLSPSPLVHDEWNGLYTDDSHEHQLYVNIGTGTVGPPMRVGATPEITLITLHKN